MAACIIARSEPDFPFQASFQRLAHIGKCHLSAFEHLQLS